MTHRRADPVPHGWTADLIFEFPVEAETDPRLPVACSIPQRQRCYRAGEYDLIVSLVMDEVSDLDDPTEARLQALVLGVLRLRENVSAEALRIVASTEGALLALLHTLAGTSA